MPQLGQHAKLRLRQLSHDPNGPYVLLKLKASKSLTSQDVITS
jgi:hypothetical protein